MTGQAQLQVREKSVQEDNSLRSMNAYVGGDERLEITSREVTTRALEEILASGLRSFHRKAYQLLRNAADAEDAVQEALLAAYTHLDQFKGESQISTWLTSIVLNCARMQLRRRSRQAYVSLDEPIGEIQARSVSEQIADRRPTPEDECRAAELSTRLNHFRAQLSPTLRRTFQLRDIAGLSIRETARILGIPHGTVKARSARARKKLKDLMRRALKPRSRSLPDRFLGFGNSATSYRRSRNGVGPHRPSAQPIFQQETVR
jgi:RNA polymerase sigma-70 factor, ECF subfamily